MVPREPTSIAHTGDPLQGRPCVFGVGHDYADVCGWSGCGRRRGRAMSTPMTIPRLRIRGAANRKPNLPVPGRIREKPRIVPGNIPGRICILSHGRKRPSSCVSDSSLDSIIVWNRFLIETRRTTDVAIPATMTTAARIPNATFHFFDILCLLYTRVCLYSYRKASIGFNFAAWLAG